MRQLTIRIILAAVIAAPAWARGTMDPPDVETKREGRFVTGLPLANFTSDTGAGYGARVYLFDNGARSDPRFSSAPYAARLCAQYFATTLGWQYHMLDADFPYLSGSDYRVRARGVWETNTNQNWFGTGGATMGRLPGGTYVKYQEALDAAEPAGPGSTAARFNKFTLIRPAASAQVERDIGSVGLVLLGFYAAKSTVRTYDGKQVEVDGADRTQGPTLPGSVKPNGIGGGWSNTVRAGVAVDTRDYEPAPRHGLLAEATVEGAARATGSDYRYGRLTAGIRSFHSLTAGTVLAVRSAFAAVDGASPFYETSRFLLTEGPVDGLGGGWTLRGYKEGRFAGRALGLANAEVRQDLPGFSFKGQDFVPILVAFGDAGRAFDGPGHATLAGWKGAAGGGLRLAWNRSTIVNFTFGRSREDDNLFIDFGHQF